MTTMNTIADTRKHPHYALIERAITLLRHAPQSRLQDLASQLRISPFHLQRVFTRWAGCSPAQLSSWWKTQAAQNLLRRLPVVQSADRAGFSSSGRLHDAMIRFHAVTPGEVRRSGMELTLMTGEFRSPFGMCFLAITERGINRLEFATDTHTFDRFQQQLQADWPKARIQHKPAEVQWHAENIFLGTRSVQLWVHGTPFQLQVWQALLRIPCGSVQSYSDVARQMGKPTSTRAVASAIAQNRIGYLIPCHRVIRQQGELGNYRWHAKRKQALLIRESVQAYSSAPG